jgi:starch-binding outer membrane protein, SusD/RagB family
MKKIAIYLFSLFFLTIGMMSCQKEYTNPSAASIEQSTTDANGLYALANGLAYRYSVGRQSPVYSYLTANALTTKEWIVLNVGNTAEIDMQTGGGNVSANNSIVTRLFEQSNLIKANADLVLNNISRAASDNDKANLRAYASLYKGLALLQLGTYWEQAPLGTGKDATYSKREDVLKAAISNWETGYNIVNNTKGFTVSSKLVGGVDFSNSFLALCARAYLMLGNYDKAIELAAKVDLTKKSTFIYDDVTRNPIFDASFSNRNVCEPLDSTMSLPKGLVPDINDKRVLFYLNTKKPVAGKNLGKGFFTSNAATIPIYLPSEMTLIVAEGFARKDRLPEAVIELNKVISKKAAADAFGIGADLPAFAGTDKTAILTEIYRQRCIELFNSGLKLEDSRRFARPGPKDASPERSRTFYPYPQNERDNNKNTPADPAE